MIESLKPVIEIIKLNTRLFLNVFKDVSDELAQRRINEHTNSMIFIASHLLDARYYMADILKLDCKCPFKDIFDQAQSIDDIKEYPGLNEYVKAWQDVSAKLIKALSDVDKNLLAETSKLKLPVDDFTKLGTLAFLAEHESYHLGQLGFLRKFFGLGVMKYDE